MQAAGALWRRRDSIYKEEVWGFLARPVGTAHLCGPWLLQDDLIGWSGGGVGDTGCRS